jgi:hypothetical protein
VHSSAGLTKWDDEGNFFKSKTKKGGSQLSFTMYHPLIFIRSGGPSGRDYLQENNLISSSNLFAFLSLKGCSAHKEKSWC